MTISEIQTLITNKHDLREIINELLDYLQSNQNTYTVQQIQGMIDSKSDLREIVNKVVDYLGINEIKLLLNQDHDLREVVNKLVDYIEANEFKVYVAQVVSATSSRFLDITGITPDSPFIFPIEQGDIQTRNATNKSPIIITTTFRSSAKGSSVILVKNNITQQSFSANNIPTLYTFNPVIINDNDVIELNGL